MQATGRRVLGNLKKGVGGEYKDSGVKRRWRGETTLEGEAINKKSHN